MMRRTLVGAVVLVLATTPAQRAVRRHRSRESGAGDPHRPAHAASLEELRAQYRTIVRMAQGLGRMDQYRTPPSALTRHDAGRWSYGRPWITALNSGDATGAAYLATATPLAAAERPARLPAAARRAFERQYATVEITDSVAMMGGHQVGLMRGYYGRAPARRPCTRERRAEQRLVVPRDDCHSRQGRGRRAARAPAGHGDEPAAVARPRAAAGEEQETARHRSLDAEHAARYVARRRRRQPSVPSRSGRCPHHLAAAIKEVRDVSPTGIRHRSRSLLSGALMVAIASRCLGPIGGLRRRDDRAKHRHCNRRTSSCSRLSACSTARCARWHGG